MAEKYITSSCRICDHTVIKNGRHVFANREADISGFLLSVYEHFKIDYSRYYKMDDLGKLGWLCSEILLKDSFRAENYRPEDIGLILSNTNSSLDTDRKYMESVSDIPRSSLFVYTLPNIVSGEICIRNNFKGEGGFFIFDHFDADFIHQYVSGLLDNNVLQACICGWIELLGNEYKAVLFLIEKSGTNESLPFTTEQMKKIFDDEKEAAGTIPEVFIAGVGAITAIGNNVPECLSAFEKEEAGMADIRFLQTRHRGEIPVAEVKLSNSELAEMAGATAETSRTILLSIIAAEEAIADADIPGFASLRTGIVSANTVGGMDKSEDFFIEFLRDNSRGKLKNVFDHECGSVTEATADHLGITDFMTTISTACSSSANAIFYGARLIRNNILDVVIAGGTDSITKFTLNGFNTLEILDRNLCTPFDENRKGLNLGEGAGYLVLVSEKVAKTLSNAAYCKLSGYNNRNDAYHQTASSPDGSGPYLAMKAALEKSGLAPAEIDYLNLHGTGTSNNDSAEGNAVKRLFDPKYPLMSSTKSFTGHTLGASGAVEAVFSVLAIRHGIVYPNLRLETQMEGFSFAPERKFLSGKNIKHVMSNSFGFGGNCTSLIFSGV